VPPVDKALMNPYQDLIYPITVPIFVLVSKKKYDVMINMEILQVNLLIIVFIVGLIVSLILLVTVKKRDYKPRPRYVIIYYINFFNP
jgi:hypothetical protein